MRRHAVGLLAVMLLGSGAALLVVPSGDEVVQMALGACWRMGVLLAVIWLAYRDLERLPAWIVAIFPVALIVLAIRPRWFLILVPVILALAILKPRSP